MKFYLVLKTKKNAQINTFKYIQDKYNNKNAQISEILINNRRVPRIAHKALESIFPLGSLGNANKTRQTVERVLKNYENMTCQMFFFFSPAALAKRSSGEWQHYKIVTNEGIKISHSTSIVGSDVKTIHLNL